MAQIRSLSTFNAHADVLARDEHGNFLCPVCGAVLSCADSIADEVDVRIEYHCNSCNTDLVHYFECKPRGFFFDRKKIEPLDPEKSSINDLLKFLRSAGCLASAEHPAELKAISDGLDGYSTGFISEIVEKSVSLSKELAGK
jgi:hypothetical protein